MRESTTVKQTRLNKKYNAKEKYVQCIYQERKKKSNNEMAK